MSVRGVLRCLAVVALGASVVAAMLAVVAGLGKSIIALNLWLAGAIGPAWSAIGIVVLAACGVALAYLLLLICYYIGRAALNARDACGEGGWW